MKGFSTLLILVIAISCKTNSNGDVPTDQSTNYGDTITNGYYKILDGLKHGYVLSYRNLKVAHTDLRIYGTPDNDSLFKMDSARYFESYTKFFQQDYNFIFWLLSFKNDTTKSGLWQMYLNPLSSYIGECHLPMTNSRAAINLIENFLNGKDFSCFECAHKDNECNMKKYEEIEEFIKANRKKDIKGLRNEWKVKNAR